MSEVPQRPKAKVWSRLYALLIMPKAKDEDSRRRESIFNILLLGLLALTTAAVTYMLFNWLVKGPAYQGLPVYSLLPVIALLLMLYIGSRRYFRNSLVYAFIGLYLFLGTYALYVYGYALPEGLLTYVVVIIMSGILISNRAAVGAIVVVLFCLSLLSYLQIAEISHPDLSGLITPLVPGHIIIYLFFFGIIFLVSWLSNRDVERSLARARTSEAALRKERNLLEVKVRQRTRQLEKAQAEKLNELQRFAEFGQQAASLVHDLANPLMAVSLELEQLSKGEYAVAVHEARDAAAAMERYIAAARRQLRRETENRLFDVAEAMRRVKDFHEARSRAAKVVIDLQAEESLTLFGDPTHFDQLLANLLTNALEACLADNRRHAKRLTIRAQSEGETIVIRVQDNALGIPASRLPHIFDAFYTTKQADQGTGLGLVIARRTVEEEFGGTINVTSQKGKGACFLIRLPKP